MGWSCEGADGVRWGGGLFGVASQKISQRQARGTFNGEADDVKQFARRARDDAVLLLVLHGDPG